MDPLVIGSIINGAGSLFGQLFGQSRQRKENRRNAQFQHDKNIELLKYQLDYNTPAAQMQRFKDAGLNPHLAYTQATSGNWSQSAQYPTIQPTDMSIDVPSVLGMAQQTAQIKLLESQAGLNELKGNESLQKVELMKQQEQLLAANPYLNKSYVNALISKMEAQIGLVKNQSVLAETANQLQTVNIRGSQIKNLSMLTNIDKMQKEIDLLGQKFMLNKQQYTINDLRIAREKLGIDLDVETLANKQTDREIKALIIQSKGFENAILEIQSRFMQGNAITGATAVDITKLILASLVSFVRKD